MMVGRLLSFSDGIFSGAMLNFQGVFVYLPSNWRKFSPASASRREASKLKVAAMENAIEVILQGPHISVVSRVK